MNNRKFICTSVVMLIFMVLLTSCSRNEDMLIKAAYMSYDNEESICLVDRMIEKKSGEKLYTAIVEELIKSPNDVRYTSVFPANSTVENVSYFETYGNYSGVVVVTMGGGYKDLKGIDRTIADYCIVMSMCELEGVSGVVICCEELQSIIAAKVLQPDDIILSSASLRTTQYTVSLWYPSKDGEEIMEQTEKNVVAAVDSEAAEIVFRELVNISTETDGVSFINSATKVISVNIEKGICYLNLTDDFMDFFLFSESGENLTVRSVVNSLCDLEEIEAVQFVIDGSFVSFEENEYMSIPIEPKY